MDFCFVGLVYGHTQQCSGKLRAYSYSFAFRNHSWQAYGTIQGTRDPHARQIPYLSNFKTDGLSIRKYGGYLGLLVEKREPC